MNNLRIAIVLALIFRLAQSSGETKIRELQ